MELLGKREIRVFPERPSDDPRDIRCVRFTADQIIEITSDDYSLKLFHLTRVEPLGLEEILAHEPEVSPGLARQILARFLSVGLIEKLPGDKYYSLYPKNFANFTDHPYDLPLEVDKDSRIFKMMKENAGNIPFWESNAYFSEDGYFTEEQNVNISKQIKEIKMYIKNILEENKRRGKVKGLKFMRHKMYHIALGLAAAILIMASFPQETFAGNDPGTAIVVGPELRQITIAPLTTDQLLSGIQWSNENITDIIADPDFLKSITGDGNDPGVYRSWGNQSIAEFWKSSGPTYFNQTFLDVIRAQSNGINYSLPSFVAPSQTNEACMGQIAVGTGIVGELSPSCVKLLDFSTTTLCRAYGESGYCSLSDKIRDALAR